MGKKCFFALLSVLILNVFIAGPVQAASTHEDSPDDEGRPQIPAIPGGRPVGNGGAQKNDLQKALDEYYTELRSLRDNTKYDKTFVTQVKTDLLKAIPGDKITKDASKFKFFFATNDSKSVLSGKFILGADTENNKVVIIDTRTGKAFTSDPKELEYIGLSKDGKLIIYERQNKKPLLYVDLEEHPLTYLGGDLNGHNASWKSSKDETVVFSKSDTKDGKGGYVMKTRFNREDAQNILVPSTFFSTVVSDSVADPLPDLGLKK